MSDSFWDGKVEWARSGDAVTDEDGFVHRAARIDGNHYLIGPEKGGRTIFRGFGGGKFVIRFTHGPHAGTVVTTTNLWHQGEIPLEYRDRLPDNAVFETA